MIGCWDYALLAAYAAPGQPFTEEAYRCSFSARSDRCSARCPAGAIPRRLLSRALAFQALLITMYGVAASHAPLTVAAFTLGLSLVVLSLTGLALTPAGHLLVGGWISGGLSVAGGLATAMLGAAVLAGRFSAIRGMLLS